MPQGLKRVRASLCRQAELTGNLAGEGAASDPPSSSSPRASGDITRTGRGCRGAGPLPHWSPASLIFLTELIAQAKARAKPLLLPQPLRRRAPGSEGCQRALRLLASQLCSETRGKGEEETREPISIYYLYFYSTSVPSHGPELHPISTVWTPNRSTTVPAPMGLQSKFLNRGMQGDGEVKGNGDKTLITVTDSIVFLLTAIRALKCLVELRHSSPGQYFVFLVEKKALRNPTEFILCSLKTFCKKHM